MQRRGTDAGVIGTELVVEGHEVGGDQLRRGSTSRLRRRLFLGEGSKSGVTSVDGSSQVGDDLVTLGKECRLTALRLLEPLHDLQLDILELGLAAGQRLELMLERGQLLGVVDRPGVQQLAVLRGALTHQVDVVVRLALLEFEIGHLDRHRRDAVSESALRGLEFDDASGLREGGAPVAHAVYLEVVLLHLEQGDLLLRVDVQDWLLTDAVHGSVGISDTRLSTVAPCAATSTARSSAAWASQGHSLAQCATSITAQPPSSRCSSAR